MEHGTIGWFDKTSGYGAITHRDGPIPVSIESLKKVPFRAPRRGDRVKFRIDRKSPFGPEATDVLLEDSEAIVSKHKRPIRRRPATQKWTSAYQLIDPHIRVVSSYNDGKSYVIEFKSQSRVTPRHSTPLPQLDEAQVERVGKLILAVAAVWPSDVAETWLRSPNSFLDGARPIDLTADEVGIKAITGALEAEISGQFA